MAKIVIKKRITLEFLGDEYKDDFLVFKSIPLKAYEELIPKLEKMSEDSVKSVALIKQILEDNFIEGTFQNEPVNKEDLADFDMETLVKCFGLFTGQSSDPKG